ncbi:hypothetical protein [Sphingomonas sp. CFBP 13720]|uniref:hypothetical protein n=1 Tax=Sphingomonas sp. CFBP 13720 TaxID=2775302 RepID=UPI00177F50F9|nr:hypothetical protein [Sphingomonas sp. CFBP 13720]MBD8679265.1 hypothetical protein [Sphingomonas sp. CFBP 13720]
MSGVLETLLSPSVLQAYADKLQRQAALDLAEAKVRENEREAEAAKNERVRLTELEDADAAVRHVDGPEAAPERPQRKKRLASLNEKIPVLAASVPLLKSRVGERRTELQRSEVPLTRAVLEAVHEFQAPAVKRVRDALSALEADLCILVAADMVVSSLVGDRFPIPEGQTAPFSGAIVTRKLLATIPGLLRPPTLTLERVEQRARVVAATTVNQLKENAK